jgi:ubiquinone/menaquinone biosynthesis C-methylase UbiE
MHVTDPLKAVKEMARITKRSGSVLAVEGGKMRAFYDPDDEEFSELAERAYDAWIEGTENWKGRHSGLARNFLESSAKPDYPASRPRSRLTPGCILTLDDALAM